MANKLAQQNQGKKTHWKLIFLTKQPFQRPQSTAYAFICFCWWKRKRMAKKELFLIELVTFLFEKTTAWKTLKNDNQTYIRTQKTVCNHCQTWKKFSQPAITIIKERRKKFVREMINFSNFLCRLPLSWWIVVCHHQLIGFLPAFSHSCLYLVPGTIAVPDAIAYYLVSCYLVPGITHLVMGRA